GRRRDDNGARAVLGAQDPFDEFLHFAAALADQSDDDHIRTGVPRHHAQEDALADAAAGEKSDALTAADGQEGVDRADTDVERLADGMPRQWIDRTACQSHGRAAGERAESIERLRGAVDDAPEQLWSHA